MRREAPRQGGGQPARRNDPARKRSIVGEQVQQESGKWVEIPGPFRGGWHIGDGGISGGQGHRSTELLVLVSRERQCLKFREATGKERVSSRRKGHIPYKQSVAGTVRR